MFLKMLVLKVIFLATLCSLSGIECVPATTSESKSHIVSFVKQSKVKPIYNEFPDFDFESIKETFTANGKSSNQGGINNLVGRLVQDIDTSIDNSIDVSVVPSTNVTNSINSVQSTDDAPNTNQNTLENSMDMLQNQAKHDFAVNQSNDTDSSGNRVKQSIPVLEPVKHLLNTVRDGAFGTTNHSTSHHTSHSKHPHQLVGSNDDSTGNGDMEHHDSVAIETEEEREMVNESTGFRFLELLGTIAGMVWGFFSNIQKIFAASTGTASSLSSSG